MSLGTVLAILRGRFWIVVITFLAAVGGAVALLMVLPYRYDAQTTATIDPGQSDPVTGNTVNALSIRFVQGNMVALLKSNRVALEVVRRLNLTSSPEFVASYRASDAFGRKDLAEWIAGTILERIDARFNEGTNVLQVTVKTSDPLFAARLANAFMAAFVDAAIEIKVSGAQQTAQWLEPQTRELRKEVDDLRAKLNEFQRDARLAPITNGDSEVTLLNQITTELNNARTELLRITSHLEEAKAPEAGTDGAERSFDTPLLQSLKSSLASNTAELSRAQSALGSRNPRVLQLEATQKSIRSQIAAEVASARGRLETRMASVRGQVAELEKARANQVQKLIDIQRQRDSMSEIVRELEVKQERLNLASRQATTAQLQGRLSFSNITVPDRASPPTSPSFPKPVIVIPLAIVAGLGLGLLLALIVEALDRRIRLPRDLEFATQERFLGQLLPGPGRMNRFVRSSTPRLAAR